MEKEKLMSLITSHQPFSNHPEVIDWINSSEENKEEYILYKNLWAILQHGNDMPEVKIRDGLLNVRKNSRRMKRPFRLWNFMKYAAIIAVALFCGYMISTVNFNNEIAINEIFVPNGNRSTLVLPDGTKVWINNGTKLTYPEEFKGKDRIVELEGEGFFDVTHDKTHPFIVKIGQNRIKVLGTRFSVTAYPDDKTIKAELIAGQIQFDINKKGQGEKFQSYLMTPFQSLVFDKSSGIVTETQITNSFYNYWMNGVYQFKEETFEELAKKLERIYNVEVTFENESLKKILFSGSLNINDNVYTLMEAFERASKEPFTYTHGGSHIYIKKNHKLNITKKLPM